MYRRWKARPTGSAPDPRHRGRGRRRRCGGSRRRGCCILLRAVRSGCAVHTRLGGRVADGSVAGIRLPGVRSAEAIARTRGAARVVDTGPARTRRNVDDALRLRERRDVAVRGRESGVVDRGHLLARFAVAPVVLVLGVRVPGRQLVPQSGADGFGNLRPKRRDRLRQRRQRVRHSVKLFPCLRRGGRVPLGLSVGRRCGSTVPTLADRLLDRVAELDDRIVGRRPQFGPGSCDAADVLDIHAGDGAGNPRVIPLFRVKVLGILDVCRVGHVSPSDGAVHHARSIVLTQQDLTGSARPRERIYKTALGTLVSNMCRQSI